MNCKDIEEMLSAYANGELSSTEIESVERHLAECPDCRKALQDFRETRRQISLLKNTPASADIKNDVMTKIKGEKMISPAKRWGRLSLAAVPVVMAIVILTVLQPWVSLTPESVIAKAQDAIAKLQSYRVLQEVDNAQEEPIEISIEFSAPGNYHITQTQEGESQEIILIGDTQYYKDAYPSLLEKPLLMYSSYSEIFSTETTIETLGYLTDLQELPQETIDGTDCLHYKGTYDMVQQYKDHLLSMRERGIMVLSDEAMEENIEKMQEDLQEDQRSVMVEIWIGKDDYIARQITFDTQFQDANSEVLSSVARTNLFEINEPIIIQAPVDSQGNLLTGWSSTAPEYPHFAVNLETEVDNYNPSARRVNIAIDITNISPESIQDVDIDIRFAAQILDDNYEGKFWDSWDTEQSYQGPYSVISGKTLKYSCIFGYDATVVPPDMISKIIEDSYVQTSYIDENGQNRTETFHLEAPESLYTLSTEVPDYLVPVELAAAGEYRLEEQGATYTGGSTTGEINGRDYMFIAVNTNRDDTTVSPGILILDIETKSEPEKAAFISTGDDTGYISGATLYGTTLYASIDDSLWVIDVSDPASPKELRRVPELEARMVFSGEYAYYYAHDNIVTLDLSDPANPEKIGELPVSASSGITLNISGGYLLGENINVLYTIDISSPSELKIVNEYSPETFYMMDIAISDNHACLLLRNNETDGISVLDISNPASPQEVTFFEIKNEHIVGGMLVSPDGNTVYAVARGNATDLDFINRWKLVALDVSDPENPAQTGSVIMPHEYTFFDKSYSGASMDMVIYDNYLYWFIGNEPNLPVIEIFDLSELSK